MTSAKPKTSRPAIELIADSDCVIERFVVKPQRIRKLADLSNSTDEIYGVVAPPRTLDRPKNAEHLTFAESDRVQRLERISATAGRVSGSTEKATRSSRAFSRDQ